MHCQLDCFQFDLCITPFLLLVEGKDHPLHRYPPAGVLYPYCDYSTGLVLQGRGAMLLLQIRWRWEIFHPLLVGLGLAISYQGHDSCHCPDAPSSSGDFPDELDQVMASTTDSLESLHWQMNSLSTVMLRNRRPLDLKSTEHGGTCMVLGEECCFYVNESSVVETNVKTLKKIA